MEDQYIYTRMDEYEKYFKTTMETYYQLQPSELIPLLSEIMVHVRENLSAVVSNLIAPLAKITANGYNDFWQSAAIDIKTAYIEVDSLIAMYNRVSNRIKSKSETISKSINAAFSKARSLKQLNNSAQTFDYIYLNTFINETNTYAMQDQLVTPHDSGLMRLMELDTTPILKDNNDANISYIVPNQCLVANANMGNVTAGSVEEGAAFTIVSNEPLSESFPIGNGAKEQYNGAILGTVINFPAVRKINNIYFKPYSDSELKIIGVYYSKKEITILNHHNWTEIPDIKYDTSNYNSYEFNFEPVSAKTVMIVLVQTHQNKKKITMDKNNIISGDTTFTKDVAIESQLVLKLKEYNNLIDDLLAFSKGDMDSAITGMMSSATLSLGFGNTTDILKRLLIGIENTLTKSDSITLDSYVYKIGLYNLKISYNTFRTSGTFQSELFEYLRPLNSIRLLSNYYNPIKNGNINTIRYSVLLGENSIPVIPYNQLINNNNETTYDLPYNDFILIRDNKKLEYNLSFMCYSEDPVNDIIVKKGDTVLEHGVDFSLIDDIGFNYYNKITFNTNAINVDDVMSLQYKIPKYDKFGYNYDPSTFQCIEYFGQPNIVDKYLFKGSNSYVTLNYPAQLTEQFFNEDTGGGYSNFVYVSEQTGITWTANNCYLDSDVDGTYIYFNGTAGTTSLLSDSFPNPSSIILTYIKLDAIGTDVNVTLSINDTVNFPITNDGEYTGEEETVSIDLSAIDGDDITLQLYQGGGSAIKIVSIASLLSTRKEIYEINSNIVNVKRGAINQWKILQADMPDDFYYSPDSDNPFTELDRDNTEFYFPLITTDELTIENTPVYYYTKPITKFNYHGISKEEGEILPAQIGDTDAVALLAAKLSKDTVEITDMITAGEIQIVTTNYAHNPGSLNVYNYDTQIKVIEDDTYPNNNNAAFIITSISDKLFCSYAMYDVNDKTDDEPTYINNITKHNAVENYDNIPKNNIIVLNNTPLVDIAIMEQSVKKYWINSSGTFINIENTDVIYEPIQVTINNKIIVNKTDYISNSNTSLDEYSLSLDNKQFYQKDNQLVFNFNTEENIIIKYYKMYQKFKTQIEIVNHTRTNIDQTAEIYNYSTVVELM